MFWKTSKCEYMTKTVSSRKKIESCQGRVSMRKKSPKIFVGVLQCRVKLRWLHQVEKNEPCKTKIIFVKEN